MSQNRKQKQTRSQKGPSQSTPLEPEQPKEIVFDAKYFTDLMRNSTTDLKKSLEEKKSANPPFERKNAELVNKMRALAQQTTQLKTSEVESQVRFAEESKCFEKCNKDLIKIQSKYNELVEPYTQARDSISSNRDGYQVLAKLYNEEHKKIEESAEELRQLALDEDVKIEQLELKITQKHEYLDIVNESLAKKMDVFGKTRSQREALEDKLGNADVMTLQRMMENIKVAQQGKLESLDQLRFDVQKIKDSCHELIQKKDETQRVLLSIEQEIANAKSTQKSLELRSRTEKDAIEQATSDKFDLVIKQQKQDNVAIVEKIKDKMKRASEMKKETEAIAVKIEAERGAIEVKKNLMAEKEQKRAQLVKDLEAHETVNGKLLDEKILILKSSTDMKQRKLNADAKFQKSKTSYEKKIHKQQRKQTAIGCPDDENSSIVSNPSDGGNEGSTISSSLPDDGPIEKIQLQSSFDSSFESPAAKKRKTKKK